MKHALTTKIGDGQVKENPSFISKHLNMNIISLQRIRSPLGEGLLGMCLGEKRRLLIPEKELRNKYKEVERAGIVFSYFKSPSSRSYQTSLTQFRRFSRLNLLASTGCLGTSEPCL